MPNSTFCCPGTSLGTNDNCRYCGDVCGVGTECESDGNGGFACVPVSCEPNCLCGDGTVDPATDGLACNGGDGICACGWCVDPTDECPCGCDGNPDCVRCAGGGVCENYNEGGSCGDSGGVCFGAYCDFCHDIGGECNVGSQCCNGLCYANTCVNCIPSGGSCTVNGTDCCAGYYCPSGTCVIQ
jgi:hypothetical protein